PCPALSRPRFLFARAKVMTANMIDSIETEKRPATQGADYEAPAQVIVRDLIKRYGDLTAVAGVSFEVRRGEIFGWWGPNGAGKTTTVEIIEGLRPRDGGEVTVCGFDPAKDVKEVKKRIGVALQATALPDKNEVPRPRRRCACPPASIQWEEGVAPTLTGCLERSRSKRRRNAGSTRCRAASGSVWPSRSPWLTNRRSEEHTTELQVHKELVLRRL